MNKAIFLSPVLYNKREKVVFASFVHGTLIEIMKTYFKHIVVLFLFSLVIFGSSAKSTFAISNICPGEPTTLYWSSSNVSGSCAASALPSDCNFNVNPNTSGSSVITTSVSCNVSLSCDGTTPVTDSLSVNPNQPRCCGQWALSGSPTWNGSSCVAALPPTADITQLPAVVAYGGDRTSLILNAQNNQNGCYLFYQWGADTNPWHPDGSAAEPYDSLYLGVSPQYSLGPSGAPLPQSVAYQGLCYNGSNDYIWSNVTRTVVQPQVPTGLTSTCLNAAGTSAKVDWNPAANADLGYYLRIIFPAAQSCPGGWQRSGNTCYPNPDTFSATTYSFTTNPGQSYHVDVHGRNDYDYSSPASTDFTCQQATGNISVTPSVCNIATGASSCTVNAIWNTTNPFGGNSKVTTTNPVATPYTANSDGGIARPITISGPPASSLRTISLLAGDNTLLKSTTASAACTAGPTKWDTTNNVCADPQVLSASVNGMYFPPGTLRLSCNYPDSNYYKVVKSSDGSIVSQGVVSSAALIPVTLLTTDSYSIRCLHGSVSSIPTVIAYTATPPAPTISALNLLGGGTVSKGTKITLDWSILFPSNACTLTAYAVCTNGQTHCTAAQTVAAATLNTIINGSNTDSDDPSGSRLITTAITSIAPGHKDTDTPIVTVDWKGLGKKTFTVTNSTDFTLDCGGGQKVNKRVWVTTIKEQ